MSFSYRTGHLGDAVDLYVDDVLDEASTRRAALHLLACETCRRDVVAARAVVHDVRAVRVDPQRQACLVAELLALAPSAGSGGADADEGRPGALGRGASQRGAHPVGGIDADESTGSLAQGGVKGRAKVIVGGVLLGSAATVVIAGLPSAHPARVAPQIAHQVRHDADEPSAPRVVIVAVRGAAVSGMTGNQDPSGRMNP